MITLIIALIAATLVIGLFLIISGLFGLWINPMFGDPRLNVVFLVMIAWGAGLVACVLCLSPLTLVWRAV